MVLPSEMFPKYVKAVEWEKMIADRFQRPTHRGKFSRAACEFDVVLTSRQQEVSEQKLNQIISHGSNICSLYCPC